MTSQSTMQAINKRRIYPSRYTGLGKRLSSSAIKHGKKRLKIKDADVPSADEELLFERQDCNVGIRWWCRWRSRGYIVGGPGSTRQDVVSLSHTPEASAGHAVKLDRLQVLKEMRNQGLGTRILKAVIAIYRVAGADKLLIPAPTSKAKPFYRRLGFRLNAFRDFELNLRTIIMSESDDEPDRDLSDPFDESDKENRNGIVMSESDDDDESGSGEDNEVFEGPREFNLTDLVDELSDDYNLTDLADPGYNPTDERGDVGENDQARREEAAQQKLMRQRENLKLVQRKHALESDREWLVEKIDDNKEIVRLIERSTGLSCEVPNGRTRKARKLLCSEGLLAVSHPNNCTCKRECAGVVNSMAIRNLRKEILLLPTESGATTFLADSLRRNGMKFVIGTNEVCRNFFAAACGVSRQKLQKARELATCAVGTKPVRSVRGGSRESRKKNHAYAFWTQFFEDYCQKPNDEVRLFPVNKSMRMVYSEYFLPWWNRRGTPLSEKPTLSTFKKMRWHEDFRDVKRRPKHHHCRCKTCHSLTTRMLKLGSDIEERRRWRQELRIHDESIKAWRRKTASLYAQAQDPESDLVLLEYDDTEAMGLPRFQHRPVKSMTKSRFNVVPWLVMNHATGENDYVYMPKDRFEKGANRLITMLHATLRRMKTNYANPTYKKRNLVCIADNASDNKNNELLAYGALLVRNGWFDSVEFLFGEVGHTHNGVDAAHKIHNRDLGGFFSADFGHLVANYTSAWENPRNRPRASVLDVVFDWKTWLKPNLRKLAGFTNTEHDTLIVRGWRIARNQDGVVDIMWKTDPAVDVRWRGADGHSSSSGFNIFKSNPLGSPSAIQPRMGIMDEGYRHTMMQPLLVEALTAEGHPQAVQYNYEACENGVIKTNRCLDDTPSLAGQWGALYSTGSATDERLHGHVRFIRQLWEDDASQHLSGVFGLSLGQNNEHLAACTNIHSVAYDSAMIASKGTPYVRYYGQPASSCAVYRHEDNRRRRALENANGDLSDGDAQPARGRKERAGEWVGNFFEVDFTQCKVDGFCTGIMEDEEKLKWVFVAKVVGIENEDEKIIRIKYLHYSGKKHSVHDIECVKYTWKATTVPHYDEINNWAVTAYFGKMACNRLPKEVAARLEENWKSSKEAEDDE